MILITGKSIFKHFTEVKIPLYMLIGVTVIMASSFYVIQAKTTGVQPSGRPPIKEINGGDCFVQLIREDKEGLTKPLLLTERSEEDLNLIPLKQSISSFIDQEKLAGVITSASVYVRKLTNGNWIAINESETYSPGSLMKVATLITLLKQAEINPAILEKKILFKKHFSAIPTQTKTGASLIEGNTYSVKELMQYMILYSDNDATALLNGIVKFDVMLKLFKDLKMQEPGYTSQDYLINCADYSRFFRVLYNSSYLSNANSEYALKLLSQSAYNEGLVKYTDTTVIVAHKFGERNNNGEQQLHEYGIYYIDNDPYLIGVMTKGTDYKILPEVISGISKIVFDSVVEKRKTSG